MSYWLPWHWAKETVSDQVDYETAARIIDPPLGWPDKAMATPSVEQWRDFMARFAQFRAKLLPRYGDRGMDCEDYVCQCLAAAGLVFEAPAIAPVRVSYTASDSVVAHLTCIGLDQGRGLLYLEPTPLSEFTSAPPSMATPVADWPAWTIATR